MIGRKYTVAFYRPIRNAVTLGRGRFVYAVTQSRPQGRIWHLIPPPPHHDGKLALVEKSHCRRKHRATLLRVFTFFANRHGYSLFHNQFTLVLATLHNFPLKSSCPGQVSASHGSKVMYVVLPYPVSLFCTQVVCSAEHKGTDLRSMDWLIDWSAHIASSSFVCTLFFGTYLQSFAGFFFRIISRTFHRSTRFTYGAEDRIESGLSLCGNRWSIVDLLAGLIRSQALGFPTR